MKASNKSSIITGVALLVLAALFSISLILQPFDFGSTGPGHNNIFYLLGNMLYSVYGFSSILIPAFLLISGLSCFATQWTARKTMRLLTALVPFFTCVITENICRSIIALGHGSYSALKIIVALVTGIMLVIIEWLGIGILADKINDGSLKKQFANLKNAPKSTGFNRISRITKPKKVSDDDESDSDDEEELPVKTNPVFDDAFETVTIDEEPDYESGYTDEELEEQTLAEEEELRSVHLEEESEVQEEPLENQDEAEEEMPETPNSMITQEEFAALTTPDEMEWPNLPPQPESLPPEYDADFDENDPALEFPPKDDDLEEGSVPLNQDSADDEIVYEDSPSFDVEFPEDDFEEESFVVDTEVETEETKGDRPLNSEEYEEGLYSEPYMPPKTDNKSVAPEDPYSTARYLDSVVENPRFPHGITLHDDSEEDSDDDEQYPQPVKSKYPSKIRLGEQDDDFEEADSFEISSFESGDEPEIGEEDIYEEDDTLPFPDFGVTEEVEENTAEQLESFFNNVPQQEETESRGQTPLTPQISADSRGQTPQNPPRQHAENLWTNKPKAEIEAERALAAKKAEEQALQSEPVAPQPVQPGKIASSAKDVFSEMEAEIRRNMPPKPQVEPDFEEETALAAAITPEYDEDFDQPSEAENFESQETLDEQAKEATNLTADELSDFFNAQQEEMRPKGTEIAPNPPKIGNRATKKGPYVIPSDLLIAYKDDQYWIIDDATKQASLDLKQTLAEFGIEAEITGIKKGPVVTMFEILPAPGVRLQKIVALQDNIALSLAAQSVRIVAPIPGKQAVGIEVPNRHRSVVGFREIIEMDLPDWKKMAVPVVLGKDILGKAQLIDLAKTPHMLIAGATGSGKSVCVNSLILSILYKRSFRDVKMILVDPKVVELKLYNNIPHLLTPVITEPKKALQALKWSLCEMERRYALLDQMGVRDISNYNAKIKEQKICTEKLPYIVIIIDEFADLMATSGKELESVIARLTAMSRAVGIHLVLATQRPSVNVITGLIKANIPTRIAFMVASRTDSNIIIDTVGAEKLLGRGDMLYASAVDPAPIRIQGTFVGDQEVEDVVKAVKEYGEPDYIDDEIFIDDDEDEARDLFGEPMDDDDPLFDQALQIVVQDGKASASYLQRRLKIGYNRAARLVEEMEERGIVGPANGSKPREIIHIP